MHSTATVSLLSYRLCLSGLLLFFLHAAFSPKTLAQSGPGCDTYVNKTTADGLGDNSVNGVFAVGNTVYAATAGELSGGLSISTDGGNTFTNKTTDDGLGNNAVYGVFVVGSTVYAATLGGVSISTDGGNTFTNRDASNGLTDEFVFSVGVSGSSLYAATQSGLFISTDGGNTFTARTETEGLGSHFVWGVYVVGSTVYAATDGGLSISTDGGNTFINKTTADGLGSETIWGVYVVGSTVYAATDGGVSISIDGGNTFTNKTTADGLGDNEVLSIYAIGNTIYAGTYGGGLNISTDGGNTFTSRTTSNGLGANYVASVFALSDKVFAGTEGGLSFCTASAMPVHLLSFTVQAVDQKTVRIDWKTASETNNSFFVIERSKDLVQVQPVTNVQAAEGAFKGHTYSYTDNAPYQGTSYYRLRQVDLDGTETTYPWASVVVDNQAYGVYPNPVSDAPFRLHLDDPQTAQLSLFTVQGRQIPVLRLAIDNGDLTLKTAQKLPAGIYLLRVEERAQVREHRLVVE